MNDDLRESAVVLGRLAFNPMPPRDVEMPPLIPTGAKAVTRQRDWNRLREAIRSHDLLAIERAWEKCERWL